MRNHKKHNVQLLVSLVVVYYVLNHMHNQLLLMMNYMMVDMTFDRQLLVEHQQLQLMFDKHRLQLDSQNMDRHLHKLNLLKYLI